jgi:DNA-binding transcriptional ArsR family regulator
MIIHDLEQVRALADPLRLKILGALGRRARTTKQVAELLGEKPTKLYHHVEILERVGLVELKEMRPNRGTLEKYYQAVASRFEVGPAVFATEDASGEAVDATGAVISSFLDTVRKELDELVRSGATDDTKREALVGRSLLSLTPTRAGEVRARLIRMLEELRGDCDQASSDDGGEPPLGTVLYSLAVAFYPLAGKPTESLDAGDASGARAE